jgi:uncharacterized protein YndB with AHSA1/START domain
MSRVPLEGAGMASWPKAPDRYIRVSTGQSPVINEWPWCHEEPSQRGADAMTGFGDPAAASATSVRFEIEVAAPIEHTFRVFTEQFDSWWPRDHHIGRAEMAVAIMEPRAGGRWYELGIDGSQCEWGVVLAWDPPSHIALSWHLDGEFRFDPDRARASRVDVHFEPRGADRTLVSLEHSGLDRHGDTWHLLRDRISRGWPTDLRRFRNAVEGPGLPAAS